MAARPCVFIHTNDKQIVGALVSAHSMRRNSAHADAFDVRVIHADDYPFLREREGQSYMRDEGRRVWRMNDLQSFTPLRFLPPELMGYEGRAILVDPDVFAVGDVWELLSRDMQGKAIFCRDFADRKGYEGCWASSVMLLDCAKLTHWRAAEQFARLFEEDLNYSDWIYLKREPPGSIGLLEPEWNDLDRLTPTTRMLHNTGRETQPWKTGLPVDFTRAPQKLVLGRPSTWFRYLRREVLRTSKSSPVYRPHPDGRQEAFFFDLLRECLEEGTVTEEMLREEMARDHVRHDALEMIRQRPRPAA